MQSEFLIAMVVLLFALVFPIGAILGIIAYVRMTKLERQIQALIGQKVAQPMAPSSAAATDSSAGQSATMPAPRETVPAQPARVLTSSTAATSKSRAAVSETRAAVANGTSRDLESVIGSAWLNRIGIVVLLFAAAFFLKLAFDNNWIGPYGRVVIGLLSGAGLLLWSERLYAKRWAYFSEGIVALAVGVLYLSLYAGFQFYHFIPPLVAFAGMAATTATIMGLALARNSERLALVGLAAGFITPLLIHTGADPLVPLFSYLAILNAGLLVLARLRDWRSLPTAFFFTIVYAVVWWGQYFDPSKLGLVLLFATIFFGEFSILPLLRARQDGAMRWDDVGIVLLNAGWYAVALNLMFNTTTEPTGGWRFGMDDTHRWVLTLVVLGVAALHIAAAQLVQPGSAAGPSLARSIYGSIALALVTAAVPIRLQGHWVVIGWSVEAAALVWGGFATRSRLLRGFGLVLAAIVAVFFLVASPAGGALFFNARFAAYCVFVGALWVAVWQAARNRQTLSSSERTLFGVVEVAANVFGLAALTHEVWDWGTVTAVSQLSASVVWAIYATVLIAFGVWRNSSLMRWQALVLFGIVIGKIFLVDLTALALGFRVAAFFIVGVLLLGVSFLYQRRRAQEGPKT